MMIQCNSKKASMRAEQLLYFNNSRILGEDFVPVKSFKAPPPPTPVAWAAVRSKAVVLLLLTWCL